MPMRVQDVVPGRKVRCQRAALIGSAVRLNMLRFIINKAISYHRNPVPPIGNPVDFMLKIKKRDSDVKISAIRVYQVNVPLVDGRYSPWACEPGLGIEPNMDAVGEPVAVYAD